MALSWNHVLENLLKSDKSEASISVFGESDNDEISDFVYEEGQSHFFVPQAAYIYDVTQNSWGAWSGGLETCLDSIFFKQ